MSLELRVVVTLYGLCEVKILCFFKASGNKV